MATLKIPQEQWAGFEKLVALDDATLRTLATALREQFPGLNKPDVLAEIASSAANISSADANDMMEVLITLYILRSRQESPVPDFVKDVSRAMDETEAEGLKLSGDDRDRFQDRLAELLSIESATVESKAIDVQFENEHTFHSARIVTDVRPIFGPDPEDAPIGAVIVHMLKITYRERTRMRDLFVALDTEDVSTLGDLADRADLKAKSLKAFLAKAGLPLISLNDE